MLYVHFCVMTVWFAFRFFLFFSRNSNSMNKKPICVTCIRLTYALMLFTRNKKTVCQFADNDPSVLSVVRLSKKHFFFYTSYDRNDLRIHNNFVSNKCTYSVSRAFAPLNCLSNAPRLGFHWARVTVVKWLAGKTITYLSKRRKTL